MIEYSHSTPVFLVTSPVSSSFKKNTTPRSMNLIEVNGAFASDAAEGLMVDEAFVGFVLLQTWGDGTRGEMNWADCVAESHRLGCYGGEGQRMKSGVDMC